MKFRGIESKSQQHDLSASPVCVQVAKAVELAEVVRQSTPCSEAQAQVGSLEEADVKIKLAVHLEVLQVLKRAADPVELFQESAV